MPTVALAPRLLKFSVAPRFPTLIEDPPKAHVPPDAWDDLEALFGSEDPPIEWVQAIKMTGEASPYVGKILDTAFAKAAAIVVLFTPDDEARLRRKFRKTREPLYETELTGQARPNVLFEAGRAFDPKSTVLVEVGDEQTRPFSDVAGRHVVHLTGSPASRRELATKLRNAGCDVNDTGSEWLTVCNFR
jgi:hypothetical protein